ncbi:hypothetical protein, partial [Streptomyces rubiginosohelvolus]
AEKAARQDVRVPFLPVIDTKLNVWTLTAVLTAWTADPGRRGAPPCVCRGRSTHQFRKPSLEQEQTPRSTSPTSVMTSPAASSMTSSRRCEPGLLSFLVTRCTETIRC